MLNRERILATNENAIQSIEAPAISSISREASLKFEDRAVKRKKMDAFKQKFDDPCCYIEFRLSTLLSKILTIDASKEKFENRRFRVKLRRSTLLSKILTTDVAKTGAVDAIDQILAENPRC